MEQEKKVILNWNKESKRGSIILFMQLPTIVKYALPLVITDKQNDLITLTYPITTVFQFEKVKKEIEAFKNILNEYKLDEASESLYHSSHILQILTNFNLEQISANNQQIVKDRLLQRLLFLKEFRGLPHDSFYKYDITIKGNKEFNFNLKEEPILTNELLHRLYSEFDQHFREHESSLYNLLENGATKDMLKAAITKMTNHQINRYLVVKLIRNLINYLNSESLYLKGNSNVPGSVTNQQGNFIYDLLTAFHIYKPKRFDKDVVKHHDSIRKLLLRAFY